MEEIKSKTSSRGEISQSAILPSAGGKVSTRASQAAYVSRAIDDESGSDVSRLEIPGSGNEAPALNEFMAVHENMAVPTVPESNTANFPVSDVLDNSTVDLVFSVMPTTDDDNTCATCPSG